MNAKSRRMEPWETRNSLDSMIDRGMEQHRRKAELSSGWKKAGIAAGFAGVAAALVLGVGYLRSMAPQIDPTPEIAVEQNSGTINSGLVVINSGNAKEPKSKTVIYEPAAQDVAVDDSNDEKGIIAKAIESILPYSPLALYDEPPKSEGSGYGAVPEADAEITGYYDSFSIVLSKARLYDLSHSGLLDELESLAGGYYPSGQGGTILRAVLDDENNAVALDYEKDASHIEIVVDEATIDRLISGTAGYRKESINIEGGWLRQYLESSGQGIGGFAEEVSRYTIGNTEPGLVSSYLFRAELVNFVPGNGANPLLNIITDEGIYTFQARDSAGIEYIMDAAGVPR